MGFGVQILFAARTAKRAPGEISPGSEGQHTLTALTPIQSSPRRRNA